MESQLTIQALWEDDGLLTIDSHAASWGFVGKTQVYTTYEALEKWAKELAGLPLIAGNLSASKPESGIAMRTLESQFLFLTR